MFSFSRWDSRTGSRSRRTAGLDLRLPRQQRRPTSGSGLLGRMRRRSRIVASLLLLLAVILWPLVHFTTRVPDTTSRSEFIQDGSGRNFANEKDRLQALGQEGSNVLKEPLGLVYADNSSDSVSHASWSDKRSEEMVQGKELPMSNLDQKTMTEEEITVNNMLLEQLEKENEKMGSKNSTNTTLSEITEREHKRLSIQTSRDVDPGEHQITSDARVRQLKDQLTKAKVYVELEPIQIHAHFMRELHAQIKDVESTITGATQDSELPEDANDKLKTLEGTIFRGKQILDDCVPTEKSLRASIRSTEGKLRSETKQTEFLTQLAAKTLPRGLHCLALRLSIEYYSMNSTQQNKFLNLKKLEDPTLFHYALFSDNVLAAAVVVNSTLCHAKNPADHVFHIVTDRLNYAAMRMWFLANPPVEAAIQVQKIDEFTWLNSSYIPVLKQLESQAMIDYYFRTHSAKSDGNLKYRNPKYLSILNHLRFYLSDIFPKLWKVVFLDDDIVVQKDLSGLWDIDLQGKVNGAVETCGKSFHRFDRYLNFSNPLIAKSFDPHACGWAYGMNVFDLAEWRKQNITEVYHSWQQLNSDRLLWKLGSLPPGLITFYNRTLPLNRSWHVLGLGYDKNVKKDDIDQAAVIHYNGNMKPWLDIGMAKFRNYWSRYLDYDQIYIRECNIVR